MISYFRSFVFVSILPCVVKSHTSMFNKQEFGFVKWKQLSFCISMSQFVTVAVFCIINQLQVYHHTMYICKCDVCKKKFKRTWHLKRHKRIHFGEKPYKCEICGRTFNQSSGAKTHKRTHTGEKNHECDICHKVFARKWNVKRHKMTTHA
jgi:uncharacterized Zn-finger protein